MLYVELAKRAGQVIRADSSAGRFGQLKTREKYVEIGETSRARSSRGRIGSCMVRGFGGFGMFEGLFFFKYLMARPDVASRSVHSEPRRVNI